MTTRSKDVGMKADATANQQDTDAQEVNFDGIVGPTHNYAGLSFGNIASTSHGSQPSNPRAAALQGLDKMQFVHQLGVPQAVLPPLRRPRLDVLRSLGFTGSDAQIIDKAWCSNRELLAACYSASNMWMANAATVSPSPDCSDGKVHFTPANLQSSLHRSIEAHETTRVLEAIFADQSVFVVHQALPANATLSDEGAANHTRLCGRYCDAAVEIFVYGRTALDRSREQPKKFPARQTLEASCAVARRHGLEHNKVLMIQQHPEAIDAGVFHNDVIAVGNRNVLLYHDRSFADLDESVKEILACYNNSFDSELHLIKFTDDELPLQDAVASYLFNSQLLSLDNESMILICPSESAENDVAKRCVDRVLSEQNPIVQVKYLNLRQSMNNGGGPACLRLRVALNHQERQAVHPGVMFDDALYNALRDWVNQHYRDHLVAEDFRDPKLIDEIDSAFHSLSKILNLKPNLFGL